MTSLSSSPSDENYVPKVVKVWRATITTLLNDFGKASKACTETDGDVQLAHLVETVQAIDNLASEFKMLREKAREYLLETMIELKKNAVEADGVTARLSAKPRDVIVGDEKKIPDSYFVTKRSLDRHVLTADLRAGVVVEGAVLDNGGQKILTITGSANK